ncbi:hypothetical protein TNCV_560231 [Trichonephila clavipes]|nr:hypothetical protein TNCV_560231 [Trichonephila clavipes]
MLLNRRCCPWPGWMTTVPISTDDFHRVDTIFLEIPRFQQQGACDWPASCLLTIRHFLASSRALDDDD